MIIALIGASGSGKSVLEKELATHHGFEKIISYTTRDKRDNETDGKDYYFTNNSTFNDMLEEDIFAEYDEYPQGRLYGTLKTDYVGDNKVVVLTPNGFRQIKKNCPDKDIFTVLVQANLGTRVKRYIDRCGVDKFNYDDAGEIFERINRDFGMFLGLEREVDFVIYNNEGTEISDLVKLILNEIKSNEVEDGEL